MSESCRPRVALTTGTLHLPGMHYVTSQAEQMRAVEAAVFAVAVDDKAAVGLPAVHSFERLPLPYTVRRRTYPLAGLTIGRALQHWDPALIHQHFLSVGGWAAEVAARQRIPLVTTVHAAEPFLIGEARGVRQRMLRDNCIRVLDGTHIFLAVSDHMADWLTSLGVDTGRVRTHYVGVDTAFWQSLIAPEERLREPRIVFVGHLTELKGVRDAVAASLALAAELPHRLDIVGDGPLRPHVERGARDAPHITVHGARSKSEVRAIMDRATALVLPTKPHRGVTEAAGMVLLEAQALGVPAVAYATGGTPEMVCPDSAYLIPTGDVTELQSVLARLLQMPAEDYAELARSLRSWVETERSLDVESRKLERLYIDLAGPER